MSNCDFFDEKKPQIYIGEKTLGVAISNCRLRGGAKVESHAPGDTVQLGQNIVK